MSEKAIYQRRNPKPPQPAKVRSSILLDNDLYQEAFAFAVANQLTFSRFVHLAARAYLDEMEGKDDPEYTA